MKLLLATLLLCSTACYASQTGTYTVDSGGCVTVDRDMRQDDLKIEITTDSYTGKELFESLKGWFE